MLRLITPENQLHGLSEPGCWGKVHALLSWAAMFDIGPKTFWTGLKADCQSKGAVMISIRSPSVWTDLEIFSGRKFYQNQNPLRRIKMIQEHKKKGFKSEKK
jgi:hypothetical protein